jgi:hypothetical protein
MTRNGGKGEKTRGAKRDERDGLPALIRPFPRLTRDHGQRATPLVPTSSRNARKSQRSGAVGTSRGTVSPYRVRAGKPAPDVTVIDELPPAASIGDAPEHIKAMM